MKKIKFLIIPAFLFITKSHAQSNVYDTSAIPEAVRKKAAVVVRSEKYFFDVTDIDRATLTVDRVLTIMNEKGANQLFFQLYTDKFISLQDVEIKLFNKEGKIIEKYKQKDLETQSDEDGLVTDGKIYYKNLSATSYPITVEYSYTEKHKGIEQYPNYQIQRSQTGVEKSEFVVRILKSMDLRYKEKNIHLLPVVSDDNKYKQYSWSVTNLAPFPYEEGTLKSRCWYPKILIAANQFKLDDYQGDMTSWKNLGDWNTELRKGADVLPEDRKLFYRNLVINAKTDREKISILYKYMQNNFRYISIQLGIGGDKPMTAEFTDQKKYGDCKGLSNFMQAILATVGIKSYPAIINAGNDDEAVDPTFPCDLFNHVIVCIPQKTDSIWLECTSKTTDMGVLGNFTENKNALLITENGGFLVPTPKSNASENRMDLFTTVKLNEDGSGTSRTILTGQGEYKQSFIGLIEEKADDQKEAAIRYYGFKDPETIVPFSADASDKKAILITQTEENITDFKTSNKMFLKPRIHGLWQTNLPKSEGRTQNYYFDCPYEKKDTTVFNIPDGFTVDFLPADKSFHDEYADYQSKFWYDKKSKSVYSTSSITLREFKIPARDYADVKIFFDKIEKEDALKIVLKREDSAVKK